MYFSFLVLGNEETRERKRTLREVAEDSMDPCPDSTTLLDAPIEGDSLERAALDKEFKDAPFDPTNARLDSIQPVSAPLAVQEVSTSSDSSAEVDQSNEAKIDQADGRKQRGYHERSSESESLLSDVLESADKIYNKHLQGRTLRAFLVCAATVEFVGKL